MARAKTKENHAYSTRGPPNEDVSSQDKHKNDPPISQCASSLSATADNMASTASTATTLIDPDTGMPEIQYSSVKHFFQEYYRLRDEGYDGFCVRGIQ